MKYLAVILLVLTLAAIACSSSNAPTTPATYDVPEQITQIATRQSGFSTAMAFSQGATQTADGASVALYLANINAQQTQQAAQQTASALSAYLTATTDTQHVQETAVIESRNATATEEAREVTATSQSVSATAVAIASATQAQWTQAAIDRQATADAASVQALATAQAAQAGMSAEKLRQEQIATYRADYTKIAWAIFPFLLIIATFAVGIWGLRSWASLRVIQRDSRGAAPILAISGRVVDPDRTLYPVIDPKHQILPPVATQTQITENAQKVQAIRALPTEGKNADARQIAAGMATQKPIAPLTAELPPSAPWSLIDRWQGGALPLGMGAKGLITATNDMAPHLLVAGTTGSGKTRGLIRPLTACALADGRQVIIFDRSGVDYQPFDNHPNAHVVRLDEPEDAIGYLASAYTELQRRLRVMTQAGASLWEKWPARGPMILIVMDEFSDLADEMPEGDKANLWKYTRMLAAEGRKAGIHLIVALQDPTAKSIDLRIRRNCTRISFHVQEMESSRVILGTPGAERIPPGQFLVVLGNLIHGVGFQPSDDEILAFLSRRAVPNIEPPEWLRIGEEEPAGQSESEIIIQMYKSGESLAAIQRAVCGYSGGKAFEYVKSVLEETGITGNNLGSTGIEDSVLRKSE